MPDVTPKTGPNRREAYNIAAARSKRTNDERLRHVFYVDGGERWCVLCDELWPCDVRLGRAVPEPS